MGKYLTLPLKENNSNEEDPSTYVENENIDKYKEVEDRYNAAEKEYNIAKEEYEKIKIAKIKEDQEFYWKLYAKFSIEDNLKRMIAICSSYEKAADFLSVFKKQHNDNILEREYIIRRGRISDLNNYELLDMDKMVDHISFSNTW